MPAVEEPEVLDHPGGRAALSRRGGRILGAVASALVVAGGVDAVVRQHEKDGVADCAQAAAVAVDEADRKQSFMADYLAPAFYSVPAEGGRETFYDLMATEVSETVPLLERAQRVCAGTDVLPWHASLRERAAAYGDYLDARIAWAHEVAADGRLFYRDDEGLAALREQAFPTG